MRDGSDRTARGIGLLSLVSLRSLLTVVSLFAILAASAQDRPGLLNRTRRTGATQGLAGLRQARPAQQPAAAPTSTAAAPAATGEGETASDLNFNQTPVDLVFETYSRMVGKTILKDPQVPSATITLKSEAGQKLSEAEQIEAIEIVLEMNGVHLEPYGEKFIRALPRKDARKEGIPLIMDSETKLEDSGKVVSMMIPFKNIATEEAQKALEGFKSNSGILLVFERTNSILVTDTEQNINRMLEIARAIDVASPVTEVVEYIQIKYANANEVKQVIDSIVQESMKEQEKNGKTPQNNAAQNSTPARPSLLNGLRRPGQQNNQPAEPVNNQSLVMTVSDADRGMIRGKVVSIADERSNKILLITNASNMKFFKQVIEAIDVETTPDTVVKVYRLKYAEAEDVSDMINDLIGNSVGSKDSKGNQNQNAKKGQSGSVTRGTTQPTAAKKPANQRTGEAQAGELTKDNTTVLADKRINGLVVMTMKELVPTIEQIIESMDIKLSQVLIETCIIEVTLGDGLEAGVDWVQKGRQNNAGSAISDQYGNGSYYTKRSISSQNYTRTYDETTGKYTDWVASGSPSTSESYLNQIVGSGYSTSSSEESLLSDLAKTITTITDTTGNPVKDVLRNSYMNNYGGATSVALGGGMGGGVSAATAIATNVLSVFNGKGLNMVFNSDELGIAAILKATQTDNRAKYLASPVVMTVDNKEATIDATTARQFITGWQSTSSSYAGSGMPTPNYTSKDIGIKVKVTPKINPNGTVMLEVEEEYLQVAGRQSMLVPNGTSYTSQDIDVPTTRKMTSDVLLENMQTVVFGGLVESYESESETGIPFLKDIPYIGKWLFGTTTRNETRTELLVFMTPYVLDDGAAAQAEALRRKKTMSDARAWDDHGWSLSNLADPVSKKEQMRRLKDEWKKQDEERKTRIAIEEEKVKRAKALETMSKDERELWLKMHKEELDDEKQDELEKKMLDKDSQEELKKLAADIRSKKLQDADKALKKAEAETAADNERAKLDAEKAAKAKGQGEGEVKPEVESEKEPKGEVKKTEK